MVVYCNPVEIGPRQLFELKCTHCGTDVGCVTGQEVLALSTGKYGPVLCFDCEDKACPVCGFVLSGTALDEVAVFGECYFCHLETKEAERARAMAGKGVG